MNWGIDPGKSDGKSVVYILNSQTLEIIELALMLECSYAESLFFLDRIQKGTCNQKMIDVFHEQARKHLRCTLEEARELFEKLREK